VDPTPKSSAEKALRAPPPLASAYRWFTPITTRWMDNDVYGHVNNVVYYSWFDSAANHFLIREAGLVPERSEVIGLVVSSSCNFHRSVAYPMAVRAGVRVDRLGDRSVTWGLAIFDERSDEACAHGQMVHVFVDRQSRRPVALPAAMRRALEGLLARSEGELLLAR
jgi:acyl-CoA thioester hydrolase